MFEIIPKTKTPKSFIPRFSGYVFNIPPKTLAIFIAFSEPALKSLSIAPSCSPLTATEQKLHVFFLKPFIFAKNSITQNYWFKPTKTHLDSHKPN